MNSDIILYEGRPRHESGRSLAELRTYDVLDFLGVSYIRADHPAAMTMEACQDVDRAMEVCACKNLFLRNTQKTEFYLLILPGEKRFKTKDLSKQLGIARLSFAEEEYMVEYLGLHPGSVSVMGLINDSQHKVHLILDEEVYHDPYMVCHPCANTSSIKFSTRELFDKILPFTGHVPVYVKL